MSAYKRGATKARHIIINNNLFKKKFVNQQQDAEDNNSWNFVIWNNISK